MEFDKIAFGQRIREKRLEIGMTQEELARKTGYFSRSSINKIEQGLVDPPQSKTFAIAEVLRVSPWYLMGIGTEPCKRLSEHEIKLIEAYRENPKVQPTVDKVLNIELDGYANVYVAAHSRDRHQDRIIRMSTEDIERIKNAPETDDPLM